MNTLTLSGWTQPADAVARALGDAATFDYSDYPSAEASFEGLKRFAELPYVIAWSMGGQLALRAIAAGVLRPKHLTLIAPPYRFVGEGGMDAATYALFRDNYRTAAARSKERFHALIAKGHAEPRRIMGLLGHHPEVEHVARWLPWFDDLGRYSLDSAQFDGLPPTLVIHGARDAIVPLAQSRMLQAKLPQIRLSVWEDTGHAPHLEDIARLRGEIEAHRA